MASASVLITYSVTQIKLQMKSDNDFQYKNGYGVAAFYNYDIADDQKAGICCGV